MSEKRARELIAELNQICQEFEDSDGGPSGSVPAPPSSASAPLSGSVYVRGGNEAEIARRDRAKQRRGEICQQLVMLGPSAQEAIAEELKTNPYFRLRANLVFVLSRYGTRMALDAILRQSQIDRNENVLRKCVEGLMMAGERSGLKQIAQNHEGNIIGHTAQMALAQI